MIQRPNGVSLTVCQLAIVDDRTRRVSLINAFHTLPGGRFPSEPQTFIISCLLTDGLGPASLEMTIDRIDNLENIFRRELASVSAAPSAKYMFCFVCLLLFFLSQEDMQSACKRKKKLPLNVSLHSFQKGATNERTRSGAEKAGFGSISSR